jgi:Tol biopolymer transport system component
VRQRPDKTNSLFLIGADGKSSRELTTADEDAAEPACAPDGSKVAFTLKTPDGTRIAIVLLRGAETRVVSDARGFDDSGPVWSPGGRRVAFEHERWSGDPRNVWLASSDGSRVRRLARNVPVDETEPTWSPAGRELVVARAKPLKDGGHARLWRVQARTGIAHPITHHSAFSVDNAPAWSPTGAWVAFSRYRAGTWICLTRPDGSGYHAVTLGDKPVWSADGRRIVFERTMYASHRVTFSLWTITFRGGRTVVRKLDRYQHWAPPPGIEGKPAGFVRMRR